MTLCWKFHAFNQKCTIVHFLTANKMDYLDVLPRTLLKSCADVFAPVFATLANLSLQSGKFPSCYKKAQVLPLL